jgi:branched-chain amino acid transport system ATP-binding protein
MGRTFQRLEAFGSLTVRDNVRVAFDIHRGLSGMVRPAAANVDALLERVGIAAYAQERAETETDAFGELLRDLAAEGRGVLMVEHDMDLVMTVCDVIHVLDFGEVIASGSPAEVRADHRVQQAYLGYSDEAEMEHDLADGLSHHLQSTRTDLAPVGASPTDEAETAVIPAVRTGAEA